MVDSDSDSDNLPWGIAGNSTCLDWTTNPQAVWPYCPSFGAAVFFALLYALTTFTHLAQAIAHRKPFCWVIIMAATWEFGGFAIRAASTQYQGSLGLFFFQQVLILLAPIWLNAFVSFLVQLAGGSMLSSTDVNTVKLGQNLYMSGVGIQLGFFTAFLGLTVLFYRNIQASGNSRQTSWKWLLYTIFAEYVLIAIRIIFRLVEFSGGVDGPVPHTESYFYIFDALTILTAIALFNICHPGRVLVGPESEFKKMTRAEKKRLKYNKVNEIDATALNSENHLMVPHPMPNIYSQDRQVTNALEV